MTAAAELALVVADLCEARGVSVRDLVDALGRPVLVSPSYVVPDTLAALGVRDPRTWFEIRADLTQFTPGLLMRIK